MNRKKETRGKRTIKAKRRWKVKKEVEPVQVKDNMQ